MRFLIPLAASALLSISPAQAQSATTPPAIPAPLPVAASAAPAPPATLFKLGADVFRVGFGGGRLVLPFYGGAERQLARHWSLTADLGSDISWGSRYARGLELERLSLALGARYYYSQGRRQRKGKLVRTLGGTYLQLQYRSGLSGYFDNYYYGPYYNYDRLTYRHVPGLEVLWGYQRRLGRHGFCDLGAGVGARYDDKIYGEGLRFPDDTYWALTPTLRARVGVAF
ncbi:hypothetical protein EJV47_02780 [Hymenobacter gummosus]|uniref:DUF3575 domain-containing protein n=1 Tax=Hymenobacter gummosus TaxID=1776032 RepID=A0A3S0JL32_9BACT|nr:hypothetical protein [Hymenobacter gummosus]RTQ53679.1 hypothetical protein EJV47_02780 [Hymenobacter gummosus]